MMLLGLALLLQVGTKDLAPEKKIPAGVKLDTADKNFSVATTDDGERDAIVKALEPGVQGVRQCWKTELESHPRAHGTIVFAFTILPDGSLSRPVVKSDSVQDKSLTECSTKSLGRVTTTLADKTVRVVAPLVFTNGTEVAAPPGTAAAASPEGDAAIDAIFTLARGSFDSCYATAKKKDPRAAGTIEVTFFIEDDGSVRDATISGGTMRSMAMNTCSSATMHALKFPAPAGGRAQFSRTLKFPEK